MNFEWDESKNQSNIEKHGISFEEVTPLFESGDYEIAWDKDHSTSEEDRWIARGRIEKHGVVVVIFVEIVDDLIRIISARKEG